MLSLKKIIFLLFVSILLSSCSVFERLRKSENGNNKAQQQTREVISEAREQLGSPYKFGGTTSAGYDCSGLVFTSFQEIGMKLPRTSAEQASVGKEIGFEKVRPGDLVFFSTKKGEDKITHVGIVTEIKEKEVVLFIHAANAGVQEDNLYAPYYKKTFVKATRPIE